MDPFLLGYITGLVTAIFIAVLFALFRSPIYKAMTPLEHVIEQNRIKPKGFIFEPEDQTDIARQEIIKKNSKEGKDTPISQLM